MRILAIWTMGTNNKSLKKPKSFKVGLPTKVGVSA